MSLDQKIAELDDFINNFLKEHFHKADIEDIKPHLINYIKKDKNVIAFFGGTSEEAEFAIKEFIKKACDKYYKQVTAYKEAYFNEQDGHPSSNHLIDNVLDRFFDSIKFYIDEFLAEEFPNQTLFLERATVLKGLLTDQREFIRNKLLQSISKSREQIRLSLREDEAVQHHAKLSLDYSPYNLAGESLCS